MIMTRYLLPISVAAAALAMPGIAAADALVVRASGPSAATYPVGRRLQPAERIVLRAGDRITIVGEGPSRTLAGPGNFPVRATSASNAGSANTLSRYLSASGTSIGRTGAVRSGTTATVPGRTRNLWSIDVEQSGARCILDTNDVTLFRSDMRADALMTIANAANPSETANIAFVAGQNFRAWPREALPIRAGVTYRVSGAGAAPVDLTFVVLPNAPADAESAAGVLASNNCTAQLADLGEELASSGVAP